MIASLRLYEHTDAFGGGQGEIFAEIGVVTAEGAFHERYFLADDVGEGGGGWRGGVEFRFREFPEFLRPFRMVVVVGHPDMRVQRPLHEALRLFRIVVCRE